jgi:hypothetical protein
VLNCSYCSVQVYPKTDYRWLMLLGILNKYVLGERIS